MCVCVCVCAFTNIYSQYLYTDSTANYDKSQNIFVCEFVRAYV